jgi:hypothetical protein
VKIKAIVYPQPFRDFSSYCPALWWLRYTEGKDEGGYDAAGERSDEVVHPKTKESALHLPELRRGISIAD